MCRWKSFSVGLVVCLIPILSFAEVPQMVNYQGYLSDSDGNPVADGIYFIKFKIYGSDTGNDSLWSSGFQAIETAGGLFAYKLGSFIAFPNDLFTGGSVRYLGITIGTENEMTPRTRIISSAYAIKSNVTDTADYALDIADNSVTGSKIPPNTITSSHIFDSTIIASDVNQTEIQLRVTSDCPPGYYINGIDADGNPICVEDQIGMGGDITAVYADDGLTGGGTENDVNLSVGAGTAIIVNPDNVAVDVDALAGGGLVEVNNSLRVLPGIGLEIDDDSLGLNYQHRSGHAYDSVFVNESAGSADIFDIPGVASKSRYDDWQLSGNIQTIQTDSINCPSPGYVLAMGTVTFYFHSGVTANKVYVGVSERDDDFPDGYNHYFFWTSGSNNYPVISVHGIFPVVDPGLYTYWFLCQETEGEIFHKRSQLSLIFFPAAYGEVHDPAYLTE